MGRPSEPISNIEDESMINSGKDYHFATSYDRYGMKGHRLDWPNQPRVYKTYDGIDPIPLPEVSQFPETSLWTLTKKQTQTGSGTALNLERLSQIFTLSFSLTAKSRQSGYEFYYRSVASAGALYPNELYLGAYAVDGLDAGIYHYGIHNRMLSPLRSGTFGRVTAKAVAEPEVDEISACFFITGIFFRSAWKYRARAFRYVLLDAGHLLENLLLALKALRLPFSVHYDFDDRQVGKLLGLDGKREACLVCVMVRGKSATFGDQAATSVPVSNNESAPFSHSKERVGALPEHFQEASGVSGREISYDEILSCYQAGIPLTRSEDIAPELIQKLGVVPDAWEDLSPCELEEATMTYPQVVFRRRSKRNYVDQDISRKKYLGLLDLVIDASYQDLPLKHRYSSALTIGYLAGNIEDTTPGFYLLDSSHRKTGLVSKGYLTYKMASVCLDQNWLRSACNHFLFMTNLQQIDRTLGPRSYRYAMLTAGRIGQTIYLGATALGLGCCGIGALYDGEARDLLGLNQESALLYLVAVGPVKRI
jgi:SagB-type dehydrogenase family enzyme